jgi:hypothetical protein
MSSSSENFTRLAEARTRSALKQIRLIGNLSNRSAYQSDPADVRKVLDALEAALRDAKRRFETQEAKRVDDFAL